MLAIVLCTHAAVVAAQRGTIDESRKLRDEAQRLNLAEKYAAASRAAEQALKLDQDLLGAEHPDTATSQHALAEAYAGLGEYAKALPLAQQALATRKKVLGAEDLATAESLNDLGVLYLHMGDIQRAGQLIAEGLRVRRARLGGDNPAIAESLNNLAAVSLQEKKFAEARAGFEEALKIKEGFYGADHVLVGTAHTSLAAVYLRLAAAASTLPEREDFNRQALAHALRAKTIVLKNDPQRERPDTAKSLINLAWSLWQFAPATNDEVRDLFRTALAIREQALGTEHPETAQSTVLLAIFEEWAGHDAQALTLFERALAAEDRTLANLVAVGNEEQKLAFVEQAQGHYFAALSLIQHHFAHDTAAVRSGLELVLHRKGIVLDVEARAREAVTAHLQGTAVEAWQRVLEERDELSKLLVSGGGEGRTDYKAAIEKLQRSIQHDEESLGARSAVVAQELAQTKATTAAVAQRLPKDGVLIEFVRLRDWNESQLRWDKTARYLAFVLTPENALTLVDLGDADAIDAAVADALTAINDPHAFDDVAAYGRRTDAALSKLYGAIIAPLGTAIGAQQRLIVSPDSQLNRVPFPALKTSDGRYLVEQRIISAVSSGRDLLREKAAVAPDLNLLLVANPAFDDKNALPTGGRRGRALRPASFRGTFGPLPGTAQEAAAIQPLISGKQKILVREAATESAVRAVKSPKVLHLATHGFFLPDIDETVADPLNRSSHPAARREIADPLLHSGLALAGANFAYTVPSDDDGILYAREVEGMDLYGTDLVVLSACETALGDIRTGEGVYGLRRAFVLAGARNLIMSLWPVDDEVTRDLMEHFYRGYRSGTSVAESLRNAELETIASLRAKNEAKTDPPVAMVNLWAPFIVQQVGQ